MQCIKTPILRPPLGLSKKWSFQTTFWGQSPKGGPLIKGTMGVEKW